MLDSPKDTFKLSLVGSQYILTPTKKHSVEASFIYFSSLPSKFVKFVRALECKVKSKSKRDGVEMEMEIEWRLTDKI